MAKKKSIQREMKDNAKDVLSSVSHDLTRKQYQKNFNKFIVFCRSEYDCKTLEETKEHIQDYSDWLQAKCLSASTIHTYIAAVCKVLDVPMNTIEKPIRHVADFTKGREKGMPDFKFKSDEYLLNEQYQKLFFFAKHTGIRREEYAHLQGDDLVYDKSGNLCVRVKRGKGAKQQLQIIEKGYEKQIAAYFTGKEANELIFEKENMSNKLNLHLLRAERAWDEYQKHISIIKHHPEHRQELEKLIRERWQENIYKNSGKVKLFPESQIKGQYVLRGKTREYAIQHGKPIAYDRLVVMYVSIFCLSHWRLNVTVQNYLLPDLKKY